MSVCQVSFTLTERSAAPSRVQTLYYSRVVTHARGRRPALRQYCTCGSSFPSTAQPQDCAEATAASNAEAATAAVFTSCRVALSLAAALAVHRAVVGDLGMSTGDEDWTCYTRHHQAARLGQSTIHCVRHAPGNDGRDGTNTFPSADGTRATHQISLV